MKLCVCCKKCGFEPGYSYSEYTYADKEISCYKNKIEWAAPFNSQEDFHKWNTYAEQCTNYEPAIDKT